MSQDRFKTTSIKTPSNRLKDSLGSILFGILLMLGGMFLLFWNEGRTVKRIQVLDEGKAALVELVYGDEIPSEYDNKLVYLSGMAESQETLRDPLFEIEFDGINLRRQVEMYQWSETKNTNTKEDNNGNEVTTTTYSYDKGWSSSPHMSAQFVHPEGHQNPAMPFQGETYTASDVRLGSLKLSNSLVSKIDNASVVPLAAWKVPATFEGRAKVLQDEIYLAKDIESPQIGDIKIWFSSTAPCVVSVIAKQKDGLLERYDTDKGTLEILKTGSYTSDELFAQEKKSNAWVTWGLRLAGWMLVWVGCAMVFSVFDILAIFIPFIGAIIRKGVGLLVFMMASFISLLTIAAGWIFYRPIMAYALIGIAVALLIIPLLRKQKA